eukprot:5692430-Pyramimonas_sp.AAC.2
MDLCHAPIARELLWEPSESQQVTHLDDGKVLPSISAHTIRYAPADEECPLIPAKQRTTSKTPIDMETKVGGADLERAHPTEHPVPPS